MPNNLFRIIESKQSIFEKWIGHARIRYSAKNNSLIGYLYVLMPLLEKIEQLYTPKGKLNKTLLFVKPKSNMAFLEPTGQSFTILDPKFWENLFFLH